jgi:hypothetical protein
VNGSFQRWLRVFIVSAVTALVAWKGIPGTQLDRAWFSAVASSGANGPLFVSGEGSRTDAWKLRTFSSDKKSDKREAPVIVSLADDVEGFFQSTPPAPIDLAVILTNFQRLGAKKAATAAMFAWEKPDTIGLAALEKSLAGFESLVMAAPLSRGVVPTVMPPSFRRCSLPVAKVQGDTSMLPIVNRLPIPGIILGGETTITGFSTLEAEAPSDLAPLVARWEDRVVFSFSLLTVLQRLDLPLDGVEVRLGKYMKLGPAGPLVPIDAFGRLATPLKNVPAYAEISAEALIDGSDELFPKEAPEPVILRDDQSSAESATRAFSKSLSAVIAAIASNGGLSEAKEFPRLSEGAELAIFSLLVLALAFLSGASDFVKYLSMLVLAVLAVAAQWIAAGSGSIWLPGLPMVATTAVGGLVAYFPRPRNSSLETVAAPRAEVPVRSEEVIVEPVAALEETPPPKKAAVRKTTPRKTAAKKIASKEETPKVESPRKTAAKKAATPRTPPATTQPPTDP